MIIKEDIPKHTQVCSDGVTADVDLEDLFFVKVFISLFMKVTFLTHRMAQRKLNLL